MQFFVQYSIIAMQMSLQCFVQTFMQFIHFEQPIMEQQTESDWLLHETLHEKSSRNSSAFAANRFHANSCAICLAIWHETLHQFMV